MKTLYDNLENSINILPVYPNLPNPKEHKIVGIEHGEMHFSTLAEADKWAEDNGFTHDEWPCCCDECVIRSFNRSTS